MPDRSPIDRVFGAIVPRAVGAVDPDALLDRIDLDTLVERIDVATLIERIDVDALITRVDIEALLGRIDVDGLLDRIDIGQLLERIDVDALVARIDVDELVGRVGIEALLERIDIDALVNRIDLDGLVGRLDVNAVVGKVDLDAVLSKVDMPALVASAGIDDIVSQAATGVASRTLDLVRRQLVGVDTVMLGVVDRVLRRPAQAHGRAIAGRPAGPVSRLAAFAVDWVSLTLMFSVSVAVGRSLLELFTSRTFDPARGGEAGWGLAFVAWAFLYFWVSLSVAGRTIGKALIGLRVMSAREGPLGPLGAALRTFVFPLSFIGGLGFVPAVVGRPRRALHDYAGGSREVVDWGSRDAALPSPLSRWLDQHGAIEAAAASVAAPIVPPAPATAALEGGGLPA